MRIRRSKRSLGLRALTVLALVVGAAWAFTPEEGMEMLWLASDGTSLVGYGRVADGVLVLEVRGNASHLNVLVVGADGEAQLFAGEVVDGRPRVWIGAGVDDLATLLAADGIELRLRDPGGTELTLAPLDLPVTADAPPHGGDDRADARADDVLGPRPAEVAGADPVDGFEQIEADPAVGVEPPGPATDPLDPPADVAEEPPYDLSVEPEPPELDPLDPELPEPEATEPGGADPDRPEPPDAEVPMPEVPETAPPGEEPEAPPVGEEPEVPEGPPEDGDDPGDGVPAGGDDSAGGGDADAGGRDPADGDAAEDDAADRDRAGDARDGDGAEPPEAGEGEAPSDDARPGRRRGQSDRDRQDDSSSYPELP